MEQRVVLVHEGRPSGWKCPEAAPWPTSLVARRPDTHAVIAGTRTNVVGRLPRTAPGPTR